MSKWSDPSPQLIQRFRRLACLTLAEAAELVGTAPAVICNWENGKHKPTSKSLNKLAKAYNRDVSDFYLADVQTIRNEATSEIMNYFRDPKANKDRKASIASHLLTQLPDASAEHESESENTAETYDPLKDLVEDE